MIRDTIARRKYSTEDRDKDFSFFIAGYFVMNSVNTVFSNVFQFSGTQMRLIKLILAACLFYLLFNPLLHLRKNEWAVVIFSEFVVCLLYFYSYLLGSSWNNLSSWASDTIIVCVPLMLAVLFIYDLEILRATLVKASWIIFFLQLLIMLRNSTGRIYDIHFSYTLCFLVLIHLNEVVNNKKKLAGIVLVIELIMLVLYGSRGALVCIACFAFMIIFTNTQNRNRRILYATILVILLLLIINLINHGDEVYYYLRDKGISSRTLRLLLSGEFVSHDSERIIVWASTWEAIKIRPFLGWGINGARDFLAGHAYPHQLFLELWLSFGFILGSIIIILLLVPMRKVFLPNKGANISLLHIFFCIGFISLMFSGTVFTSYYFFILFGILLRRKKTNHGEPNYET